MLGLTQISILSYDTAVKYCLALLTLITAGCGGYKLVKNNNPFVQYGIESVTVPMFFNQSVIPNTAGVFTSEFFKLLTSYHNLKVYSGVQKQADAVLLGIISSPQYRNETISVAGQKKVHTLVSPDDLGQRNDFFTPTRNQIVLTLKVILIKNPNGKELKLFQSELANMIDHHPKVIFNETIQLRTAFSRKFKSRNMGGVTNFTNNLGTLNKAVQTLAVNGRNYFKEIIINAF